MTADHLTGIEKSHADLWKIADDLRANSGLDSNEYFMPIMGILFLRHATNRYCAATTVIKADQAASKMPKRPPVKANFVKRGQYGAPPDEDIARIVDTYSSRQVEL